MPSGTLRLILGDQLSLGLSSLRDGDRRTDVVLMAEVRREATYVKHHKQKIALIFAAMRAFAADLREAGWTVVYRAFDAADPVPDLETAVAEALAAHDVTRVVATEPGEWRLWDAMGAWPERLGVPVELRDDDRFIAGRAEFAAWAEGRKSMVMEHFYRRMRQKTGLLMTAEDKPEGGTWNLDKENRKALPKRFVPPKRLRFTPTAETEAVLTLVETAFPDHFGTLEGFGWATTRAEAEAAFEHFIADCLPVFGDFQDAMKLDAPWLNHAVISPYLNIGLLDPLAVCRRAEAEYHAGRAPLNAVEGFIRQILGWREYVRGLYWHLMPGYEATNHLGADRPLPDFYWTGATDMTCLSQAVRQTHDQAYAHHIQRLMVTGMFALVAGLDPAEVNDWYMIVYADAYHWVELPNTHGMALYADGGVLATKPYAASGKYIDRMSDYCRDCRYDVATNDQEKSCPFNYLYWNFMMLHEERLGANRRLAMPYRTLARMEAGKRQVIAQRADAFLDKVAPRRALEAAG